MLFDLNADSSEKYDVSSKYPEIVEDLKAAVDRYKEEIDKNAENKDLIDWFIAGNHQNRRTPRS